MQLLRTASMISRARPMYMILMMRLYIQANLMVRMVGPKIRILSLRNVITALKKRMPAMNLIM